MLFHNIAVSNLNIFTVNINVYALASLWTLKLKCWQNYLDNIISISCSSVWHE